MLTIPSEDVVRGFPDITTRVNDKDESRFRGHISLAFIRSKSTLTWSLEDGR